MPLFDSISSLSRTSKPSFVEAGYNADIAISSGQIQANFLHLLVKKAVDGIKRAVSPKGSQGNGGSPFGGGLLGGLINKVKSGVRSISDKVRGAVRSVSGKLGSVGGGGLGGLLGGGLGGILGSVGSKLGGIGRSISGKLNNIGRSIGAAVTPKACPSCPPCASNSPMAVLQRERDKALSAVAKVSQSAARYTAKCVKKVSAASAKSATRIVALTKKLSASPLSDPCAITKKVLSALDKTLSAVKHTMPQGEVRTRFASVVGSLNAYMKTLCAGAQECRAQSQVSLMERLRASMGVGANGNDSPVGRPSQSPRPPCACPPGRPRSLPPRPLPPVNLLASAKDEDDDDDDGADEASNQQTSQVLGGNSRYGGPRSPTPRRSPLPRASSARSPVRTKVNVSQKEEADEEFFSQILNDEEEEETAKSATSSRSQQTRSNRSSSARAQSQKSSTSITQNKKSNFSTGDSDDEDDD